MKFIRKLLNGIHIGTVVFAMACLVAMAIIVVINVFLRYLFNTAIQWGEEVTLILVSWFTFIAMAMGVKLSLHISISILPHNMPAWLETLLTKIKRFVTLVVGIVLLVYGIILVGFTSRSILPATGFPSAIMYLPMPVASIIIIYESILVLLGIKQDDQYFEKLIDGVTTND